MEITEQKLNIFWTFSGNAEEAMQFYEKVLPGAKIQSLTLFEKDAPHGDEGKVLNGSLSFAGHTILFMDMQAAYPCPPFSWSTSFLISCDTEAEFDEIFASLSQDGLVMMGPEEVYDIRKCTWVTDRFGVTWQLIWK